jgi:hypothetical protein
VIATVAFADLDIAHFADTTFEAQFRDIYITTVSAEANVSASQVNCFKRKQYDNNAK